MITFEKAIERVLSHEGGYVNHPQDPGSETQWGISKASYPHLDIKRLTREDAKSIYRRDYWNPVATSLPASVTYQALDSAVNHGIGNTIRFLQRALDVADDGRWGPVSKAAAARMSEHDLLLRFLAERLHFMTKLRTWDAFGRGWSRRIAANLRYAAEDTVL